jgi:hypothetical protein
MATVQQIILVIQRRPGGGRLRKRVPAVMTSRLVSSLTRHRNNVGRFASMWFESSARSRTSQVLPDQFHGNFEFKIATRRFQRHRTRR